MPEASVRVVAGVDTLEKADGPIFAVIGVFDGIHLGHGYLFRHLVSESRSRAARPAVITFDSHPDEILVGAAPPLLLDPEERLRLLEEAGVEVIVVQHFDAALRMTEYDEFIHRICARTRLAGLLMTPDAAFGHDRGGTPVTVAELGQRDGFDLVVVPPLEVDGRSVRSSDVRAAIGTGDLAGAARLLGRPYSIVSTTGAGGSVAVAMPVALPPVGEYHVDVRSADVPDAPDRSAMLVVEDGGSLRIKEADQYDTGTRILISFEPAASA